MREFRPYGSVRGARGDMRPYRDIRRDDEAEFTRISSCTEGRANAPGSTLLPARKPAGRANPGGGFDIAGRVPTKSAGSLPYPRQKSFLPVTRDTIQATALGRTLTPSGNVPLGAKLECPLLLVDWGVA